MKYYIFKDPISPGSDVSIKNVGFLPSHMVVIKQVPKNSLRVEKKGQWSDKEVGIFNPNNIEIEAEIKFYG